jgi:hypothetical protein
MLSFIKRIFSDVLPNAIDPASFSTVRRSSVGPTIALVNQSTVVTDSEVKKAAAAIQIQIDRDFGPVWNTYAKLQVVTDQKAIPPGAWVMYLLDTSDQVGALGYHDITDDGAPIGKMFCKDDQKYGLAWTVTLSHEILEILIDPYVQNSVFDQATNTTGTLYALEVADACLTGDTKIPLLDGTSARIDELVNRDEFWVYSCTPDGEVRPGRGHSARRTRADTEIVEVLLDNGEKFKCTADHRIMCRDGNYKMAGNLAAGESLMPLYRRKVINHKVVSVIPCGRADVYDITVDEYHNFAVQAGVFVHNCEADEFGYKILDVLVSDFVYPTWFEGFREPHSTKFDHMDVLKAPYELAKGGYIGVFAVGPHSAGWTQRVAHSAPGARLARKGPYSRTKRRQSRGLDVTNHKDWR